MKSVLKNHLAFSKKECNGMVVMLLLLFCIISFPYINDYFRPDEPPVNFEKLEAAYAKLAEGENETPNYERKHTIISSGYAEDATVTSLKLHRFNPNHLPEEQWKQLGLTDKQIKVIKNYEAKGGKFYKKEDFKKIYGISVKDYIRLAPYIDIPEKRYLPKEAKAAEVAKSKIVERPLIELNQADSLQLLSLRGIGPVFASRIIKYRDKLGGFANKMQLMEVYGVDTVKYQQLEGQVKVDAYFIRKIRINQVDYEGFKSFPYLNGKQKSAILQYRKQHGEYHSMLDLSKVLLLDEEILLKIEPYLEFHD